MTAEPPERRPSGAILEEILTTLQEVAALLRAQREREKEQERRWKRLIIAAGIIADPQADDD